MKFSFFTTISATIAGLILLFTNCDNPTVVIDPITPIDEIRERWDDFIQKWEAEDAEGCSEFYTEYAQNIPPESSIKEGRKEIEEFYSLLFKNNLRSKYQHEILNFTNMNNHAFELGRFQVDWQRNDSTEWTFQARSMTHWVKAEDGSWQIATFLFNTPPEN